MQPRLTTEMQISAAIRQAEQHGIYASILKTGDARSGSILLEIQTGLHRSQLLSRYADIDGEYDWMVISGEGWLDSAASHERREREIARDPDCWVVLVEDSRGRNIFTFDEE